MNDFERRPPRGIDSLRDEISLLDLTPQHVYITSAEDRERAHAVGVEAYRTGTLLSIRPVMSRADYANFKFACRPAVTGFEGMLYPFLKPGTQVWAKYMSTRKVVESVDSRGRRAATVVTNMAEKLRQVDSAAGVSRVYRLTQVLTDGTVQRKFGLTEAALRTLQAMAIVRPVEAARHATILLSKARPDLDLVVDSAGYAYSKKMAKRTIEEYCGRFPDITAVSDCAKIGSDLFMYGLGDERHVWHVSGPLAHAAEVALVHRAVEACGASPVMFALGSEFVTLKIDIALRDRYLCPDVEFHVGDGNTEMPDASSPVTRSMLSFSGLEKLMGMQKAVVAVEKEGSLVASCVRVSARYYVVGDHVVSSGGDMTVDGAPMRAVRTVGRDLWLLEASGPPAPGWPLREAQNGERVVVCYRTPSGAMQYTSPLSVLSVGPETLALSASSELTKGMSGGAVVALDDMALLGIYEGAGRQQAMALTFSSAMFADAHSVSEDGGAFRSGDLGVLQRMRDRGLGAQVDSTLAAVVPLYSGTVHVGHGYGFSGRCYTVCDPDAGPLAMSPGGQPMVFSKPDGFWHSAAAQGLLPATVTRAPTYYEKVIVVGCDELGPYYSDVSRVVHVGAGSCNFSIEALDGETDLPFEGGLVMSVKDGAVIGAMVRASASPGLGMAQFCAALPLPGVSRAGLEGARAGIVRKLFPMLRPELWPDDVLLEVFEGCSSVLRRKGDCEEGDGPLAFVGRAALELGFGQRARALKLPFSRWKPEVDRMFAAVEEPGVFSGVESVSGLDYRGEAVRRFAGTKARALLALVGAARLSELELVFERLLDAVFEELGAVVAVPFKEVD